MKLVPPPPPRIAAHHFGWSGTLAANVPHGMYHADDFHDGAPALSRSIACKLLNASPQHAKHAHPRLGGGSRTGSQASDRGGLYHDFLLGGGQEVEVIRIHTNKARIGGTVPAENFLTKEAQELRDEAIAAGKMPVLQHVLDDALGVVDHLRAQLDEPHYFADGREAIPEGTFSEALKEITALWESGGVLCKARMDGLHLGRGLVLDLKFLANAHPVAFGRSMVKEGYEMQHAGYLEGVGAVHPELAGRLDFRFILIEVDGKSRVPVRLGDRFVISVPELAGSKKGLGEARWARAKAKWRACLESGSWPCYEAAPIEAAPWEVQEEMMAGIANSGDPSWLGD